MAYLEAGDVQSDLFYYTRKVRTECKRRLRAHFALALSNKRVPWTNTSSGDAHQELSCDWNRTRHIFNDDYLFSPAGNLPNWGIDQTFHRQGVVVGDTHLFSPALVNSFSFAFNRVNMSCSKKHKCGSWPVPFAGAN